MYSVIILITQIYVSGNKKKPHDMYNFTASLIVYCIQTDFCIFHDGHNEVKNNTTLDELQIEHFKDNLLI